MAGASDVYSRQQWHASEAYQRVFRPFGVEAQLGTVVPTSASRMTGLAFNRTAGDFTDRDCEVLAEARRHIAAAHRRMLRRAAREAVLARFGSDADWLLVDCDGVVVEIGPRAASLFEQHDVAVHVGRPLPRLPSTVRARAYAAAAPDWTTLLVISPSPNCAAVGLTRRQYDALLAVADGASSRLASRRLGISEQTLSTHLRDAYRALGVDGRVAALNALRTHGLIDR